MSSITTARQPRGRKGKICNKREGRHKNGQRAGCRRHKGEDRERAVGLGEGCLLCCCHGHESLCKTATFRAFLAPAPILSLTMAAARSGNSSRATAKTHHRRLRGRTRFQDTLIDTIPLHNGARSCTQKSRTYPAGAPAQLHTFDAVPTKSKPADPVSLSLIGTERTRHHA